MTGEPIEAVKKGIKTLLNELKSDPQALETAYLSLITFHSYAEQLCPLTEVLRFEDFYFEAKGATALGGALNLLMERIDAEVYKSTKTQKGDWMPLVFIITDGIPTDIATFTGAVRDLKQMKIANIVACAAGENADSMYLKQITDNVILMENLSAGDLAKFFAWVSSSVKLSSQNLSSANSGFELPPAPAGFVIVP
jgi:uncharacterized protein YegL